MSVSPIVFIKITSRYEDISKDKEVGVFFSCINSVEGVTQVRDNEERELIRQIFIQCLSLVLVTTEKTFKMDSYLVLSVNEHKMVTRLYVRHHDTDISTVANAWGVINTQSSPLVKEEAAFIQKDILDALL